jgi:prepilin-type N-terminal cleavage/methylation domain-containing protein
MKIFQKKGMTLVELMITTATFVVLAGVALTVYIAVLRSWSSQEKRVGISIAMDRAMNEMAKDLRSATEINASINNDEIRFTQDGANYYIYYLHNANDGYPPNFDQTSYVLKKEALAGGISGTFTYGSGRIILSDIVPPTTSDLSYSSGLATIDLSVSRGDETIRSKTKVKPRNL